MTHDTYLPCRNASINFSLSITASFHLKIASTLTFSRVLARLALITLCFPLDNNARLSVIGSYASCSSPVSFSTLLSLSLSLSLTRFNPRCNLLEYNFDLINS
ncbi:unnamed protein product [Hymenolepis diminuta]|uniref:Uncharacterized protein n=1 Tax=Hymenolepis diminuta TaxID=6216 RepID=A0A564Z8B4_HYMDI|nr:unnamed protein product [Hymenolepis diminuta]